jgi:hypothetical protein
MVCSFIHILILVFVLDSYDVLVWNKALTQVRPQNYVELTLAIALTILGTRQEDAGEYLHAERGTRVIGSRDNLEEM